MSTNPTETADPMSVSCPTCGSAAGEKCINLATGDMRMDPHPDRRGKRRAKEADMSAVSGKALERVRARMDVVDAMTPEMRACVHEFGLTMVQAITDCGVTQARHVRHIIDRVRQGSAEIGNREDPGPEMLRRFAGRLRKAGFAVIPAEPTPKMVLASLSALHAEGIYGGLPQQRKHELRLQHAINAGSEEVWSDLLPDTRPTVSKHNLQTAAPTARQKHSQE